MTLKPALVAQVSRKIAVIRSVVRRGISQAMLLGFVGSLESFLSLNMAMNIASLLTANMEMCIRENMEPNRLDPCEILKLIARKVFKRCPWPECVYTAESHAKFMGF